MAGEPGETIGPPIPEKPGPSSATSPEAEGKGIADQLRETVAREGGRDTLEDLATGNPEASSNEVTERKNGVDQLQQELRERNIDPKIGGKMLVEIPLGDGSDRVVQILRPDALNIDENQMNEERLGMNSPFDIDEQLIDLYRPEGLAIGVVLPDVGPAWIFTGTQAQTPGTVRSEVDQVLRSQGREPSGTFLEMLQKEDLKFVHHPGMEQDDIPDYAKDMVGPQAATMLQKTSEVSKDGALYWTDEAVKGVSPVRGEFSRQLFDVAIRGANMHAAEQTLYQGPKPDAIISSTISTVKNLPK